MSPEQKEELLNLYNKETDEAYEEFVSRLEAIDYEDWDTQLALMYVKVLVFTDRFVDFVEDDSMMSYVEKACDILELEHIADENNSEWNETIANVYFNLQEYEEAVSRQKQVVRLDGNDPDKLDLERLYASAMSKIESEVDSDEVDVELTNEEMLAIYAYEAGSL
ncbi:MAG: hypothetical protein E6767_13635 [Dysgonomonas sp.]|nr:hypothetical protein [Dysgonomonas sp.]